MLPTEKPAATFNTTLALITLSLLLLLIIAALVLGVVRMTEVAQALAPSGGTTIYQ